MFKRLTKKAAIRLMKTYDGVEFPDSYIIKSERQINSIIEHVQTNPDVYARDTAREDALNGLPDIEVNTDIQDLVPNEPDIPVIATIHYKFNTKPYNKKKRSFLPVLFIFLTVVFIFNIFVFADAAKQHRIYSMCKIYYKHGEPTHLMFGDREYDLNNLKAEDFVFMSPAEREFLENNKISNCIRIDRR